MEKIFKIAVFASGRGSNFQAILDAIQNGTLRHARVVLLVCDNPQAGALTIADENEVDILCLKPRDFPSKAEYEKNICAELSKRKTDLVVLAGYMRIVGKELLRDWQGKIINLHPSLLPHFPGKNSIAETFAANSPHAGVSVHWVDENIDTGPVIAQRAVPVSGDTREAFEIRIHKAEHELLPRTIEEIRKNLIHPL